MSEIPRPVVIYDSGAPDGHGLGASERVAACYRWAGARNRAILGHSIAWDSARENVPPVLADALETCRREGADLLVYALECLGGGQAREAAAGLTTNTLTVAASGAAMCGAGQ